MLKIGPLDKRLEMHRLFFPGLVTNNGIRKEYIQRILQVFLIAME